MKLRKFADISISPITFGTMRLDANTIDKKQAINLLSYLDEHGVNAFHTSFEYDTYQYFCEIFKTFQQTRHGKSFVHIVKVPVPHFKDNSFNKEKFEEIINGYLQNLNVDCIDIVQWLLRHEPNTDEHRLPLLKECENELLEVYQLLKDKGKIKFLASFPYSHNFAEQVINKEYCTGLVDYLNILELERIPLLDQLEEQKKGYIAIRPLMGGKLLTHGFHDNLVQEFELISAQKKIEFLINFSLLHPAVATTIIGLSSIEHAEIILNAAVHVESDINHFMYILKVLRN